MRLLEEEGSLERVNFVAISIDTLYMQSIAPSRMKRLYYVIICFATCALSC